MAGKEIYYTFWDNNFFKAPLFNIIPCSNPKFLLPVNNKGSYEQKVIKGFT